MNPIFIYFLKVNLALALLYCLYRILFQNDTFFQLRRFTLLGIYLIAFLYPLPDISGWMAEQPNLSEVVVYYSSIINQETPVIINDIITEDAGNVTSIDIKDTVFYILAGIYFIGMFLLTVRCIAELIAVFRTYYRSEKKEIDNIHVCILPKTEEPYSFFRWVFIHPNTYTQQSFNEILIHETTHVQQKHSFDIIISEIIVILCWMNPFAWLLKKEISINHEYIADQQVMYAGYDKKEYQYHLIGMEHSPMAAAKLYNYFSVLPLKKRITMLNKKRTNGVRKVKYLIIIPFALGLLVINNIDTMARIVSEQLSAPMPVVESLPIIIEETTMPTLPPQENDKIYTLAKKMPEYPGGENELIKFINKNIKYPPKAIEEKMQGRVLAAFVVEKNGSVTNIEITRSVSPELDNEALRILKAMPKWTPGYMEEGKPVRVQHTMPFIFRLPKNVETKSDPSITDDEEIGNTVFNAVDKMPIFPGGNNEMLMFIKANMQYPKEAQDKGIQGRSYVSFIVEKDGSLSNIKIVEGKETDPLLDNEALRLTKTMPKWVPGEHRGRIVRVKYNVPFVFRIK